MRNLHRVTREGQDPRRRGIVAPLVLVVLTALVGFAALTVDIGVLYNTKRDLQAAADAAALAGISSMLRDEMMLVRRGDASMWGDVYSTASGRVDQFGALNGSWGTSATYVAANDIVAGYLDLTSAVSTVSTGASSTIYNAVQVTVHRDATGPNGSVEYLFAPIFGELAGEVHASATAAFDDRFAGIDLNNLRDTALPMTIHEDEYVSELLVGNDDYGFNEDTQSVTSGGDGIREIQIYPAKLLPGNFGLLNIGSPNQGTPALADQIENGVSAADMESEIGTTQLTFYDEDGTPTTYDITGGTGLKASLESSLDDRIGDVVSYFLHETTVGNGSNSVYTISRIVYGRLVEAQLNGNPNSRGVWVQPIIYGGGEVIVDPSAPSSGGTIGKIALAR